MAALPWRDELVFDHAIILVRDLDDADDRLRAEFGLRSVWLGNFVDEDSVANRIVPLKRGYLELLAPTPDTGDQSNYWLEELEERGEHIAGWAMRTDRLLEASRDLSAPVDTIPGQRIDELDLVLRWSVIWPPDNPDYVPFLIQYENFSPVRRLLDAKLHESQNAVVAAGVSRIDLSGSADIVGARIGLNPLTRVRPGPNRIVGLALQIDDGTLEFTWEPSDDY